MVDNHQPNPKNHQFPKSYILTFTHSSFPKQKADPSQEKPAFDMSFPLD